jgi:hypothetical protein
MAHAGARKEDDVGPGGRAVAGGRHCLLASGDVGTAALAVAVRL